MPERICKRRTKPVGETDCFPKKLIFLANGSQNHDVARSMPGTAGGQGWGESLHPERLGRGESLHSGPGAGRFAPLPRWGWIQGTCWLFLTPAIQTVWTQAALVAPRRSRSSSGKPVGNSDKDAGFPRRRARASGSLSRPMTSGPRAAGPTGRRTTPKSGSIAVFATSRRSTGSRDETPRSSRAATASSRPLTRSDSVPSHVLAPK